MASKYQAKETVADNTPSKTIAFSISKTASNSVGEIASMMEIGCKKIHIMYVHGIYSYYDVAKVT